MGSTPIPYPPSCPPSSPPFLSLLLLSLLNPSLLSLAPRPSLPTPRTPLTPRTPRTPRISQTSNALYGLAVMDAPWTSLSSDTHVALHAALARTITSMTNQVLLRSQLNAKISLSFKRDFENDHSKLRILEKSKNLAFCFDLHNNVLSYYYYNIYSSFPPSSLLPFIFTFIITVFSVFSVLLSHTCP